MVQYPVSSGMHRKSTIGGRLTEKSTIGGRLTEKSTIGGRLKKKKGKEEEEKKKEEVPRRRPRPRALVARGLPVSLSCPRVARGRLLSPRGDTKHLPALGERSRGGDVSTSSHGTHQQTQASPSSNMPLPQMFKGMREDEVLHVKVRKATGVLKSGVHCLALYKEKDEEREMLQHFSQILAIMEPRDLMDIFSLCMPELFECMITNTQLLHIFSTLLQAPKVLRPFMDVLIHFLVNNKLDALKHPDTSAAKLVLQLFRFLFMAAAKAPADSERILQPHIPVIMDVCMKNATEVEKPLGYMHLLRYMFRSMNGAKFDTLLRDLIPSLQPCLNMLLSMLEGPSGEEMRDLILELCLTLPARLSSLLPHIPRLMKPLVLALKGSDDLVSLGLRTLEFWIDSLNPDFLEPSMANVISEVILALWSHLRPLPYPWGTKALQLLGKLGGRNRRFLREPLALECKENPEHGLRLILTFEPSTPFLVPLDRCIYLAVASVMQNNGGMEAFYRKQALKFLRVCLSSLLNLRGNVQGEGVSPGTLGTLLVSSVDPSRRRTETSDMKVCLKSRGSTSNLKELDPLIFLDALVEVLASENRLHAKAALNALSMFAETLLFLARAKHNGVLSSRGGPDLKTPNHTELRAKIISMFFKSLTCRTPEIVSVAKEGLRQLGVKLLDHLKKWLEPEKLAQTQKSWKAGDEPKVAAGML
ncbi:hypothetical protein BHE74_00028432 [Ensete ventricosum]|nr:hypothetical protein BHE74_00028432 [Ensete ventricosum]